MAISALVPLDTQNWTAGRLAGMGYVTPYIKMPASTNENGWDLAGYEIGN